MQSAKCNIMAGFCKFSHILLSNICSLAISIRSLAVFSQYLIIQTEMKEATIAYGCSTTCQNNNN